MRRVLIKIEYDGREFYGFQKQAGKRTIQEELENALFKLTGEKIEVFASGRTDRGVHALDQAVHFDLNQTIPAKNIIVALNNLLPNDISVNSARYVKDDFNSRFDIKSKTYVYKIYNSNKKSAILADRSVFINYNLDIEKMIEASKLLIGKHNFKGFCASDTKVTNFEREIFDISIKKRGKYLTFEVTGSGFLYNMVRIIVGTLIDVGRGNLSNNDIEKALKTEKPKKSMADNPAPTATKNADMLIYSSIVFLNFSPFVNIVLKILMQANINKMPKEICTKIVMI